MTVGAPQAPGPPLPHPGLGGAWRRALAPCEVVHLDAAGSACLSGAVLLAQVAHLEREAAVGGYAAEAEAAPALARLRERLGALVGLAAADVALVANATAGFAALLAAWPLRRGARIGVLPSEYGSNRMALVALARRDGLELVPLPTSAAGRLSLDGLDRALATGLDLVTFPHVASHRGVVQPAAEAAARCRQAIPGLAGRGGTGVEGAGGVPLVLDVAQTAGHLLVDGVGAAAYVGTSRKWLRGPRGVGFLAVGPPWADRLEQAWPSLSTASWADAAKGRDEPAGSAASCRPLAVPTVPLPGAARLDVGESAVAARVGLAVALDELDAAGAPAVAERIAALGGAARRRLDGMGGWRVEEPEGEPSGLVTLRHPDRDPLAVQRRLLRADGVLTSAIPVARAPGDLVAPVLRASFHAYADEGDIEALAAALVRATGVTG